MIGKNSRQKGVNHIAYYGPDEFCPTGSANGPSQWQVINAIALILDKFPDGAGTLIQYNININIKIIYNVP